MSDKPDTETSTWQHSALKEDVPSGIPTRYSSKWAATDPCLQLRGHQDWWIETHTTTLFDSNKF
jgi:hypothetical protein